ncbi:MAG: hypothetical protein JNK48_32510, partial [Bryobacterales bacterium]|nr:hypothetical protein [Bryobacterales bacterium]
LLREDCFLPGWTNDDAADLAREARVTSSGEAVLEFEESREFTALGVPAAQLFPVSTERVEAVELLLRSELDRPVEVTLGLRSSEFVYDFRNGLDLAKAKAVVPARWSGYVRFALRQKVEAGRLYWVHLPAVEGLSWAEHADRADEAAVSPAGCTAARLTGATRWEPIRNNHHFCLRLTPEQRPYGAQNVARGTSRPDRWTNLWVSDALPAWLELTWPRARRMDTVQVVFDTDVNRHSRLPLFVYPDCVKTYDVLARVGGEWRRVAGESGNYLRRRVLRFEPVEADAVRIAVQETNGAGRARIYEVRVYEGGVRGKF